MNKFSFISLGCAKNRVDSETVIGELIGQGFQLVPECAGAEIVIINTCAFLREARMESMETIKKIVRLKKTSQTLNKIVVIGCLAQYIKQFGGEGSELKDVDLIIPVDDMSNTLKRLGALMSFPVVRKKVGIGAPQKDYRRFLTCPPHSVYIKITDGCNNHCAYCLIPSIRGPLKSKPIEDVAAEVLAVEKLGAKEINLIGQDISLYGYDTYGQPTLIKLINRLLASVSKIQWIRLLYVHPARIDDRLIQLMANEPVICNYIDMPIQHVNGRILDRMGRNITREGLINTVEQLREHGIALRTTVMTGYPGEKEEDFQELLDFLRRYPFDRLGGFAFSPEKGTRAYFQGPKVKKETAEMRINTILKQQKTISKNLNRKLLGKVRSALVESYDSSKKKAYGRLYSQAPEVDGKVIIPNAQGLQPGQFTTIKITAVGSYDFLGERII